MIDKIKDNISHLWNSYCSWQKLNMPSTFNCCSFNCCTMPNKVMKLSSFPEFLLNEIILLSSMQDNVLYCDNIFNFSFLCNLRCFVGICSFGRTNASRIRLLSDFVVRIWCNCKFCIFSGELYNRSSREFIRTSSNSYE